ncbi:MAG: tRNA (adenosine(37)-N6)-threonylcarbamoyltransferase complex ATPase subunit type 1 TsaE [Bryobacteraceae bacterium]
MRSDPLFEDAGQAGVNYTFETHSDEETREVGRRLAALLPKRAVVALTGDLGAGKTTLSQGIVEGRKAARAEDVSSPTFTLIHEYGEPVSVYHIDLYRLATADEARRLGLEDIFDQDALVLIEWGDRFPELLPPDTVSIHLSSKENEKRRIVFKCLARHR